MNSRKALDAPEFLQAPDEESAKDYERYLDDMESRDLRAGYIVGRAQRRPKTGLLDVLGDGVHDAVAKAGGVFPVLDGDIEALKKLTKLTRCERVLRVLMDGEWHKTTDFLGPDKGGSEGLRRVRELKAKGYKIVRRKIKGSSQHEYCLVWPLP